MIEIRYALPEDLDLIWRILKPIIAKGDSLAYPPNCSREDMLAYWCGSDKKTYVAVIEGAIAGTFYIKKNQPGRGSHIANAGFAVSPDQRGRNIGRAMGEFCLAEAKRLGFTAMQFNLVVKTNEPAVSLWQQLGFKIIGEIPEAFDHAVHGYVNAYVMYRKLQD